MVGCVGLVGVSVLSWKGLGNLLFLLGRLFFVVVLERVVVGRGRVDEGWVCVI